MFFVITNVVVDNTSHYHHIINNKMDNIDLINSINKRLMNIVDKYSLKYSLVVERIDHAYGNNSQDENYIFDMEYVIENKTGGTASALKYVTYVINKNDDYYEGKIYDFFHKILFQQNYN